ncbi:hypothetical protein [Brenneria tiliae]|uniref:Transposase n=1 Tax=Brenneria tiliae TaxID=2914984 RepID=A0ABT0MQI7_9GAMM|nr:hypothetical protein [Brenneria tiliae]MCL2892100.1 hypothetical protein [Brenneria tiliae]
MVQTICRRAPPKGNAGKRKKYAADELLLTVRIQPFLPASAPNVHENLRTGMIYA